MSKLYYELDGFSGGVVDPSPERVRNILTLDERVRAIKAYEKRPMYTEVAIMFNCSWEQIKSIVANRDTILDFYEATRNVKKSDDPDHDEIRKRQLAYLGECMYEYIQRAQFHRHTDINKDLLRTKALEFRDLIKIDNFVPNKSWINRFKATYNISLSNRQITLTRIPPDSLDLNDIMTYCGKNKSDYDELVIVTPSDSEMSLLRTKTLEMLELRRKRKIYLMESSLYEYLQRATFHKKVPANYDRILDLAIQLINMLKIEGFIPDKTWLQHFKNRFNFSLPQGVLVKYRTPPSLLDIRDILCYCRRRNYRDQPPATTTPTPKENSAIQSMNESEVIKTYYQSDENDATVEERKKELVAIENDDEIENEYNIVVVKTEDEDAAECDTPPLQNETFASPFGNDKPPQSPGCWSEHCVDDDYDPVPLKISKTETLIASFSNDNPPKISGHCSEQKADNNPHVDECDTPPLKIKFETFTSPLSNDKPQQSPGHWPEHSGVNDPDADECDQPPLKIPKIESLTSPLSNDKPPQSLGNDQDTQEPLPNVRNYKDALRLLKPLEEFAMLEENYRVIGLISQLENIFKNPPKTNPRDSQEDNYSSL